MRSRRVAPRSQPRILARGTRGGEQCRGLRSPTKRGSGSPGQKQLTAAAPCPAAHAAAGTRAPSPGSLQPHWGRWGPPPLGRCPPPSPQLPGEPALTPGTGNDTGRTAGAGRVAGRGRRRRGQRGRPRGRGAAVQRPPTPRAAFSTGQRSREGAEAGGCGRGRGWTGREQPPRAGAGVRGGGRAGCAASRCPPRPSPAPWLECGAAAG